MHCALLCPGPSLRRLAQAPPADLTIAVKRAALAFPCQWVCILDTPELQAFGDIAPGALLLTRRDCRPKYSRREGLAVEDLDCPVPRFDLYTATAALALAGHLGATTVDVYGADWSDAPDWDGSTPEGANRSPERWALERGIWSQVVEWMGRRGCEVVRR